MNSTQLTMFQLEDLVKAKYHLQDLELLELYKLNGIEVETPEGYKKTIGFMKKKGKKAIVVFDSGLTHECLHNHMFIAKDKEVIRAEHLSAGKQILTKDGSIDCVKSVDLLDEEMFAYDLSVDALDGVYVTADGIQHHNTGKTQTVEDTLAREGLLDGAGYFKNTGTASAIGIYSLLFRHRKEIILFDDSDGALGDQDARNLIKAATDTKKVRKLVWNKKSGNMIDPEVEDIDDLPEDDDRIPRYFNFEGRIIFISNLPLDKLDPDKALRTRAFVISINPTPEELLERMGEILYTIKLEDGLSLSKRERDNVFEVVKTGKRMADVSLRTLVRALNLAASGAPNWEQLVRLYS